MTVTLDWNSVSVDILVASWRAFKIRRCAVCKIAEAITD